MLLDDLDKELERRGHRFARYCDDFLIVVKSQRAGERVKASIGRFLQSHLKLEINEQKSTVGPIKECTFLGFTFQGSRIYWSSEAVQDFRHRLRKLTGRSWGVSMVYRIRKLNEYIRGWMQYFGLSQYYRPLHDLEGYLPCLECNREILVQNQLFVKAFVRVSTENCSTNASFYR